VTTMTPRSLGASGGAQQLRGFDPALPAVDQFPSAVHSEFAGPAHPGQIRTTGASLPEQVNRTRRGLAALGAGAAATTLAGCAALVRDGPADPRLEFDAPAFAPPPSHATRAVALVLSGGSARGFAHLGMLRVLEREGLRPDLIVGTSAGSIVGAMAASGMKVSQMEALAEQLDWSVVFDFQPIQALLSGFGLGPVPGHRLERFLRSHLRQPIERFAVPFAAVAADMHNGDIVPLTHGDAARAIRASCAVPGVFAPVRAGDRLLGDGQIVSPLPVSTARALGARRVLALDVVYPPHHSEITSPLSMLFQSLVISGWRQLLAERLQADLVITPEIRSSRQLGLSSRGWLIEAGERAASARIADIRRLFASA
jgi:NTE family protein